MLQRTACSAPGCKKWSFDKSNRCVSHLENATQIIQDYLDLLKNGTLIQGVNFTGMEIRDLNLERKVFFNCDFQATLIENCHFEDCHFNFCFFDQASLKGINVRSSKIIETVFALAELKDSTIADSEVLQSNFNGCHLQGVKFNGLDLMYSRFINATFLDSIMEDCNLKSVYLPKNSGCSYKYSNSEDAIFL